MYCESVCLCPGMILKQRGLQTSSLCLHLSMHPFLSPAAEERFFQKLEAEVDKVGTFTARLVSELRERLKQLQGRVKAAPVGDEPQREALLEASTLHCLWLCYYRTCREAMLSERCEQATALRGHGNRQLFCMMQPCFGLLSAGGQVDWR